MATVKFVNDSGTAQGKDAKSSMHLFKSIQFDLDHAATLLIHYQCPGRALRVPQPTRKSVDHCRARHPSSAAPGQPQDDGQGSVGFASHWLRTAKTCSDLLAPISCESWPALCRPSTFFPSA